MIAYFPENHRPQRDPFKDSYVDYSVNARYVTIYTYGPHTYTSIHHTNDPWYNSVRLYTSKPLQVRKEKETKKQRHKRWSKEAIVCHQAHYMSPLPQPPPPPKKRNRTAGASSSYSARAWP